MKKITLLNFFLTGALTLLLLTFTVSAQNEPPGDDFQPRRPQRRDILRELGLSREQIQTIRRINADRRAERESAQARLVEARRELDDAIYADRIDDALVNRRLKELHAAQAEIVAIRSLTEYEIRKVLTTEQTVRFRELRREFAAARENMPPRRRNKQLNLRRNRGNRF